MNELVIHGLNYQQHTQPFISADGERRAFGLIPRNYDTHPIGCYRSVKPYTAVDLPVIDRAEWPARIAELEATKSRISDIMLAANVPCLDQNGRGYCWAHSATGAVMALRAVMNQPTVGLSAYAIACIIKSYRDEGGWGAQALDFITERGVPSEEFWPQRSVSPSNDKPATWENAALHKTTEGWVDLSAAQYDRKLSFGQEITCYLIRIPGIKDENWWSHSILGVDAVNGTAQFNANLLRMESGKLMTAQEFTVAWGVDTEAAGYGIRIRNSWGATWGTQGFGVLAGSQAISDGAVAPRVTIPSAA